jgi:hypothetical protein
MKYDKRRKYRIESTECVVDPLGLDAPRTVECRDYADTLALAKCIAGEWLLERERVVRIIRQWPPERRWAASIRGGGEVAFQELYSDGVPEAGDEEYDLARDALGEAVARVESLRPHKRRPKIIPRRGGLVCLSSDPPAWFPSIAEAAKCLNVARQTVSEALRFKGNRRRQCKGLVFCFGDEVPPGLTVGGMGTPAQEGKES